MTFIINTECVQSEVLRLRLSIPEGVRPYVFIDSIVEQWEKDNYRIGTIEQYIGNEYQVTVIRNVSDHLPAVVQGYLKVESPEEYYNSVVKPENKYDINPVTENSPAPGIELVKDPE